MVLRDNEAEWELIVGTEPSPELAVMVAENCERLLDMLDASQRRIALLKLEGHSNAEIAQRLDCGVRTVERRLELTRRVWQTSDAGMIASGRRA
jgi:DNA-directed RNA polymerase specialized sigma24 family protein